ncbi:probable glutamate receptor isoform X2 [Procambarus clarkii]|uniref:probable glutamate receptor isoform X2 n=1 Tax=Procambarus clarkii TaxID=6728 RepID=UPI0037441035
MVGLRKMLLTLYVSQVCGHNGKTETLTTRNCAGQDGNRLAEDGSEKPLTPQTIIDGKFFMDAIAFNASAGEGGRGVRSRVSQETQVNAILNERKLYHNLCLLTLDVLDAFGLTFLTIYTNDHLGIIVPWLSQSSGIMWDISPCSFAATRASSLAPRKQGLTLVLCELNSTEYILSKAAAVGGLKKQLWLLAGLTHSLVTASPQLYLPIDSMVLEVRSSREDKFHLHEIWSPGRGMDLHQGHLASWRASLFQQQEEKEEEANPEARGDPTDRTESPDTETRVGRLTISNRPKYERRRDLTGVHFVATSISDERAHHLHYDPVLGRQVIGGYFGDVWELLKAELNFTYTVITPADGEYGSYRNGSWTGMIGDVLSGRAHVVVAHLSQTYSRALVIDFSSVLLKFSYRIFAQPHGGSAASWTAYTRPFSTGLWVGLVLTLMVLATVYAAVSHCYCLMLARAAGRGLRRSITTYREWKRECPLLVWAAITQQGWPTSPDAGALRVLFWMMYVIGVVVAASYSATLVSFLTVINDQLPFESLEDLKKLPKFRLGIQKGSVLEELFKSQKFLEYWETLIEPYSNTVVKTYTELRALALKSNNYAYVGSFEVQILDPVGACTMKSARQHLLFNDGALGWPQGSPYLQLFDHFINKFRESGLLKKLMDVWYPRPYACPGQPVVALGLQQVFTAFVLLSLGAGLSFLLLSLEKFIIQCRTQHTQIQV